MENSYLVDWGAQSVRAVAFTTAFDSVRADAAFLSAFKAQPSSYQGASAGSPFATSIASGIFKGMQATVQIAPGRLDLFVSPAPRPNFNNLRAPTPMIVEARGALDILQEAAVAVNLAIPSVSRLGVIVELVRPAADLAQANALVAKTLPYSIPLTTELDFMLQINVQKTRQLFDGHGQTITINRIHRWTVGNVQFINVQIGLPSVSIDPQINAPHYVAQVSLDYNTLPGVTMLDAEAVIPTFKLLCDEIDNTRRHGVAHAS